MRLWHKDLIDVLPRKQLLAQWRECCAIASNITNKGIPNHILVNKIMNYPIEHFYRYGCRVHNELEKRGYQSDFTKFVKYSCFDHMSVEYGEDSLYDSWHNERYLFQCFHNFQEKYDCGGMTDEEYNKILIKFNSLI